MTATPIVNTHVHVPPNFSAFTTPADVVESATKEGVRALGISNFYDQQVYERFAELCADAGIVALFGLEFITLIADLEQQGIRINDPANPGRMYLCGKGISPFKERSAEAASTAVAIRSGNDQRAAAMVSQLAEHLRTVGIPNDLSADVVAEQVAERGDVPASYVSLQERHIARAVQEVASASDDPAGALEKAYGGAPKADPADVVAVQGEVRSRLIKAGTPGFVGEVPLTFDEAYAYVLAMDGIPCYPTLADGVDPVCPFEADPDALAAELVRRGIHAAELIPIRNKVTTVDAYVKAFANAGIIVMAGTEHNTLDPIPFDPACVDGPISDTARQAFWEATCIVAAHQARVAAGQPGFVDDQGTVIGSAAYDHRATLIAEGAAIING